MPKYLIVKKDRIKASEIHDTLSVTFEGSAITVLSTIKNFMFGSIYSTLHSLVSESFSEWEVVCAITRWGKFETN